MALIEWTNDLSVGIDEIDNQHKGLVIIINDLFDQMKQGKAKEKLSETFDLLTDYTKQHFFHEEKMMIKYIYPDFNQHKSEHKKFVEKLIAWKKDFIEEDKNASTEILSFLRNWLINHIKISDKKYSPHILKSMNL